MSTLGWQILKKVREEGRFCYTKDLDIGRICKRTIPYTGVVVLENVILQFQQTFLKNYDAIRAYGVGKHNHPGDRSNVYDANKHFDNNADYYVLGSCSATYK